MRWMALAAVAFFMCACGKKPAPPAPAPVAPTPAAKVTGTVTYKQRIALPPDALVEVTLEDVSRIDAPAEVIGRQEIKPAGRQVPIPFEIAYDPAKIGQNRKYAVRARITYNGNLAWISDTAYPVLTLGNGPTAQIVVSQVRPSM